MNIKIKSNQFLLIFYSYFNSLIRILKNKFITIFYPKKENFFQEIEQTRKKYMPSFYYDDLSLFQKVKVKVFKIELSNQDKLNCYKEPVIKLANLNTVLVFPCSGIDHRKIFIEEMLSKARKYVSIFDENLVTLSSKNALSELKSFIKVGGNLRIVLSHPLEEQSEISLLINKYHELFPLQVFITKANPEIIQAWKALDTDGDLYYFAIADDVMYWHSSIPEFECGHACFNGHEKVTELKEKFTLLRA